jgi:DNA-binding CsgD family transcriptional regulator
VELLLEREDELQSLADAAARARAGHGSTVLVGGEAGIGKTSLIRALRERVAGTLAVLVGSCEPLSVPVPLGPVRDLLDAAGVEEQMPLHGEDRLALGRAVLEALDGRAPVVAVFEDVHWADPMTLDVIRILARRVEERGVLILVTFRDDEVAANESLRLLLGDLATYPTVTRLELRPLSGQAVRSLAGSQGLDVGDVMRATGGNPFLVVESIAAGGRLPASVKDAALARAGRLSAAARQLVDVAAVLGPRPEYAILETILSDCAQSVEEALARGVLIADGDALGFRHELIREALESSISPPRRSALHAKVAETLAQGGGSSDYARMAHHAELGGLTDEACRYASAAAREAAQLGALRETRLQSERALRLGAGLEPAERFELLLLFSRAANFASSDLGETVRASEEAVAIADRMGDDARRGRALITLAWALWSADRVAEASAAARRAVDALENEGEPETLARARSTHIRIEATALDPEVAIAEGPAALELASRVGADEVTIDVRISIALARGQSGDPEALPMLETVLADALARGLAIQAVRTYVNMLVIAAMQRDHSRIDRLMPEALAFCDEHHTPIPALAMESFRARSLLDRGRWDDALIATNRCVGTWHAEVPMACAVEGLIALRRGAEEGWDTITRAWGEIEDLPSASRHGMTFAALIEGAWLRGEHAAALEYLRTACALPSTRRFARGCAEIALWAARYGLPFEAPSIAPDAVALELAGDWRAAVRAWHEIDAPYEAALAALPGDERAARDAIATLRRLGAEGAVRAFARERAAVGASTSRGPRRSTLAHPAGLTRREQEVLEEMASGASNPAIAQALHLSERTVAHHVSAILGKLGASNRVRAIEQARGLGLLGKDGPSRGET